MIGGTVTKTEVLENKVWVDCEEDQSTSKCAIYVERNNKSEAIKPGDSVWWQGGFAMWTPFENRTNGKQNGISILKCGVDYDVRIKRIGFSGVARPT
jgi:hypothetical protein